jgi:HK97 family phage major capsid protein
VSVISPEKDVCSLRRQIERDRQDALDVAIEVSGRARTDPAATEDLELALSRYDTCQHRLSALSEIKVVSEPDMYRAAGPHSYFRDVIAVTGAPVAGNSQPEATERLHRHAEHEERRLQVTGDVARRMLGVHGVQARSGFQTRALSSAAGAGGEMVPPKWLTEQWASVSRAACPLRGLATRIDLPPDTLELHVPRFDTAAGVVPDQVENITAPDALSQTDATVTKVATFMGDALISQQSYDRGGDFSDTIIARDFADSYGQALAQQMISGSGANGQLLGLLNVTGSTVNNVPGARLVTYTNATPTPTAVIQAVSQCAAEISDTRERAPSAVLMRGARWFWLAGSPDGSTNVSEQRLGTGVVPADTDTGPYGPLASLPVYHDNTIPTNLGTGANQDTIVVVRAKDLLLLEDPAGPRFSAFLGSATGGQITVVLQWHHYTAVIPNRYPSAIGTVQGTGLVIPAGF